MENFIVIAIIAVAVGFGVYCAVKHFKGQGECCGGGGFKPSVTGLEPDTPVKRNFR